MGKSWVKAPTMGILLIAVLWKEVKELFLNHLFYELTGSPLF
jgi:hypothetical protein